MEHIRPRIDAATALRRSPEQTRSLDKITRITAAAEGLLASDGWMATAQSAAPIIKRARVTRGTFYTYFETPHSVMEYLSLQMLDNACSVVDRLAKADHASVEEAVSGMVTAFADYYRGNTVRELWLNRHVSETVLAVEREVSDYISFRMREIFDRVEPAEHWPDVCALTAGQLADSLLQFAFRDDRDGDSARLEEAVHACATYIRATRTALPT